MAFLQVLSQQLLQHRIDPWIVLRRIGVNQLLLLQEVYDLLNELVLLQTLQTDWASDRLRRCFRDPVQIHGEFLALSGFGASGHGWLERGPYLLGQHRATLGARGAVGVALEGVIDSQRGVLGLFVRELTTHATFV